MTKDDEDDEFTRIEMEKRMREALARSEKALDKLFEVENELGLSYEPEPKQEPHQCRGIPRKGCNYLTACGHVCNKCGEIHYAHMLAYVFETQPKPEQELVAVIRTWHKNGDQHAELYDWDMGLGLLPDGMHNLYTTPPKREWVGLTDDEFDSINPKLSLFQFYKAIEAKLKSKNA